MAGNRDETFAQHRWQLIILGVLRFSEAVAWTSIFPYVYTMVQSFDNNSTFSQGSAAFHAGMLVASFTFGEFVTGMLWARISDTIGRKPTLLLGVAGGTISAALFGIARSLPFAVVARLVGGLINPNIGVVQTMVGEIVRNKDQQARGFSIVPFLRGLGSVLGPVIGGTLAEPQRRFPTFSRPNTIWTKYPYLLPNIIVVALFALSWILAIIFLKETHEKFIDRNDYGIKISTFVRTQLGKRMFSKNYARIEQEDGGLFQTSRSAVTANGASLELDRIGPNNSENEQAGTTSTRTVTYSCQIILQVFSVSTFAFHKVSSDIIIPMFLGTSPSEAHRDLSRRETLNFNGGFGMTTAQIGNVLFSQAVAAIIFQLVLIPRIIARFGALDTYRMVLYVFPCMYLLTPFTIKLPYTVGLPALLLDLWIKVLLVGLGYNCSAILITNTTSSPSLLAATNGLSASVSCLARSVGPAISGTIFQFGLTKNHIELPFWALSLCAAVGALEAWWLRDSP